MPSPNHLFNNQQNYNSEVPRGKFGGSPDDLDTFGITTGAFGPVSNGPGIAIINGQIAADTSTMEGTLDPGVI
jgi:hypothetical protein